MAEAYWNGEKTYSYAASGTLSLDLRLITGKKAPMADEAMMTNIEATRRWRKAGSSFSHSCWRRFSFEYCRVEGRSEYHDCSSISSSKRSANHSLRDLSERVAIKLRTLDLFVHCQCYL